MSRREGDHSRRDVLGTVGQFAGGPAGSVLYAWRPAVPFVGNAVCFLAAATAIWRLPRADTPPTPPSPSSSTRTSLRSDITAGLRWIATTRLIRVLTTCAAVMNVASGLYQGALPLYALHTPHMPPQRTARSSAPPPWP